MNEPTYTLAYGPRVFEPTSRQQLSSYPVRASGVAMSGAVDKARSIVGRKARQLGISLYWELHARAPAGPASSLGSETRVWHAKHQLVPRFRGKRVCRY